ELARLADDTRSISTCTVNLAWVELLEGDFDRARSLFEEGAALARRLGRRAIVAEALWGFAQVAAARGDANRAARIAGAASALGVPAGLDPTASFTFAHHLDDAHAALGDDAWQKSWADGAELDHDAALRLALDH